ncbi:hypothetical protein LCGC14_0792260 [marine sediment metagenome]|uniref:Uncharacterized protein n=1 Tax=marine sediment metagenome TaxID=412755 RepID=A0A0F9SC54_9ZZZZ
MKNWIANKVEAALDATGFHLLATKWFDYKCSRHWYQPKGRMS